jgi:hypothetical protein
MPVLTCPSCHCKLKIPEFTIAGKGVCPRCRASLSFRAPRKTVGLEETKPHRPALTRPDADTVEGMSALSQTATRESVRVGGEEEPEPRPAPAAPDTAPRSGALLRIAGLAALAAAGGFALWMAGAGR